MRTKAFYTELIDRLRSLSQTMERIGCAGFDLKQADILTDDDAFQIAAGVDLCIVTLKAATDACRHALDVVDGLPYADPMTEKEHKIIELSAELVSLLDCSTPQNGL